MKKTVTIDVQLLKNLVELANMGFNANDDVFGIKHNFAIDVTWEAEAIIKKAESGEEKA